MADEATARLPVTEKEVSRATKEDKILRKLLQYVEKGWQS